MFCTLSHFTKSEYFHARRVGHLAQTGEAGAQRRVRDRSSPAHLFAPGIKILTPVAGKLRTA
jgi:hypothetical protein